MKYKKYKELLEEINRNSCMMENFMCYVDNYFGFFFSYLSKALDWRSYHIWYIILYFYQYSIITWEENLNPNSLNKIEQFFFFFFFKNQYVSQIRDMYLLKKKKLEICIKFVPLLSLLNNILNYVLPTKKSYLWFASYFSNNFF